MRGIGALVLVVFVAAITALANPVGASSDLSIVELQICDDVAGLGNYSVREGGVFHVGEVVYVYVEVEAQGHGENSPYLYNLSYTVEVVNPLGLTSSVVRDGFCDRLESSKIMVAWWTTLNMSYKSYPLAGTYEVLVKVRDEVSGREVESQGFFTVIDGLTPTLRYSLSEELTLRNPDPKEECEISELYLALIPSLEPYQVVVEGPSFSRKPDERVVDSHGNVYAVFKGLTVPPRGEVTLVVDYTVDLKCLKYLDYDVEVSGAAWPKPIERYLEPSTCVESGSQQIVSRAESLTSGLESFFSRVRVLLEFVNNWLTYDSTTPRNLSALEAYTLRRGVCEQYARLFTALCRASGMPARVVSGFGFLNPEPGVIHVAHRPHAWAQVYLPATGWIPIETQDPSSLGATLLGHIAFTCGEDSSEVSGRSLSPTLYNVWYTGSLEVDLTLTYTVTFIPGNLTIKAEKSEISLEPPPKVLVGTPFTVRGNITPPIAGIPISVTITDPQGQKSTSTVMTDASGGFTIELTASKPGSWVVEASWSGNAFYEGCKAEVVVEVSSLMPQPEEFESQYLTYTLIALVVVAVSAAALAIALKARR